MYNDGSVGGPLQLLRLKEARNRHKNGSESITTRQTNHVAQNTAFFIPHLSTKIDPKARNQVGEYQRKTKKTCNYPLILINNIRLAFTIQGHARYVSRMPLIFPTFCEI